MKDFASAALYGLMVRELARQGIQVEVIQAALQKKSLTREALVPLQLKRELLAAVYERHGAAPLLAVGAGIRRQGFEPALHVLARAHAPLELIHRWQRLEKFVHSRHRVEIVEHSPLAMTLRHVSLVAGEPPLPAEDYLIAGLLCALLEAIGCEGIALDVGADTALWRLQWAHHVPRPVGVPAVLRASTLDTAPIVPIVLRAATPEVADVVELVAGDTARNWSVAEAAAATLTSRRTLQRRLARSAVTFKQLVQAVRVREACRLLTDTAFSPSEIGYWCGFSDQSHFSREFKRRTNATPIMFRQAFASHAPPNVQAAATRSV